MEWKEPKFSFSGDKERERKKKHGGNYRLSFKNFNLVLNSSKPNDLIAIFLQLEDYFA